MISMELSPESIRLMDRLRAFAQRTLKVIAKEMDKTNQETIGHIVKNRMSRRGPDTLGVRSGLLRKSIRASSAVVTSTGVESTIGSNVVYAGIHEYGGKTRPHTITPRRGKALKFLVGDRAVYARSVNHPGSLIPARAPIRRGVEERAPWYRRAIETAATQALGGGA